MLRSPDPATPAPTAGRARPRAAALGLAALGALVLLGAGPAVAGAALDGPPAQVGVAANLTVAPDPAHPGEAVLLDARNSTGGEAAIASCAFDADGDGQFDVRSQDCLAEWTYGAVGDYEVVVRVRTEDNQTATASERLAVRENQPPIPAVGVEPARPRPGEPVALSAAGSRDPDGRIVRTAWRLPDRTFAGEAVEVTFPEPGEYAVSLAVTDDDGLANETTRTITVVENRPPSASLSVVDGDPRVGEPVELDASGTEDPDGRVVEFRWDLDGDGDVDRVTEDPATALAVEAPGSRRVTVTAVDDAGATATAAVEFDVVPAATATATASPAPTDAGGPGTDGSDSGLAPLVPDWAALLVALVAAGGVAAGWRRRETLRTRLEGLRDRLTRGDIRRRAARLASGTVTKTAAKRLLRAVADGVEVGGRGIGDAVERLGRGIKRWSGRIAAALRRLAG